jgi:hypothetical protein
VTPVTFSATLVGGQNKCYQIRFKLRQLIPVIVLKIDDAHAPLANWRIRAEPGPGNVFAVPVEGRTGADGTITFRLSRGRWVFIEYAPPGVNFNPILPATGRQELNVVPPGPHRIRFKNDIKENGCIRVIKVDNTTSPIATGFPLAGWGIEVRRADGSVATSGLTDGNGQVSFTSLPFGPYTVVEETRLGWEPDYTNGYTNSYDVYLVDNEQGQCVEVRFVNRQAEPQFCIEGRKIDTNGKIGLPGWKITITPKKPSDYTPSPNFAVTDGLGMYKFTFPDDDYRIPGAYYQICEEAQPGWLPHTATCYTVQLPHKPGACIKVRDFENQQTGHGRTPPGPTPGVGCRTVYTAQRGDGLFAVGARYGVSGQAMINANPWIRNRHKMYLRPGDQVCIP